jgi:hypothetical protein
LPRTGLRRQSSYLCLLQSWWNDHQSFLSRIFTKATCKFLQERGLDPPCPQHTPIPLPRPGPSIVSTVYTHTHTAYCGLPAATSGE